MDQDFIQDFVAETFDLLDEVEPQLIELSTGESPRCASTETLNAVFRLFHTMKGGAGFLGLSTVSGVTHEAETLLDLFRKGKGTLCTEHVHTLCATIDFIRLLLKNVAATGTEVGHEHGARHVTDKLRALIAEVSGRAEQIERQPEALSPAQPPAEEDQTRISAGADAPPPTAQSGPAVTPAMRASYAQEAEDALDQAEHALLALESPAGQEVHDGNLGAALRALHSIKGNSGFMGFADVEALAHRMESALELLRNGTAAIQPGITGMLLKMIDMLRATVAEIAGGGQGEIQGRDIYLDLLDDTVPGLVQARNQDAALAGDPAAQEIPVAVPAAPVAETPPAPPDPRPVTRTEQPAATAQPAPPKSPPQAPPSPPPAAPAGVQTRQDIRVDIQKLDALVNLVGELVIAESMVTRHPHVAEAEIESLDRATHLLRRVSRDLQDVVMSARMIPLAGTFRKMIRLVHDLAGKSGKQIALKLVGEATEVDKTVIEQIGDPLVHIIRNAADHGVEHPGQRRDAGKAEQATITVEGRHEGGEVWIMISDDGRGLNRERILAKARDNGLVGAEADEWSDERVFRLIFEPGFSTAEQVTDVSGRGVGMDVVKKNIEKLKGRIDIRSRPGLGSTFILRIPLTLAIIEGMMVRVGEARYTIPLLAIRESVQPEPSWITTTPDGQESVRIRDDFYPVLRLHQRFNKTPDHTQLHKGILILVECDRRTIALFVDEILGRQETVIKGLSSFLGQSPGVSGCTILGDGQVSLILDVAGLVAEREER
ncbi:chemotaxis protein CheA [Desulfonatronum thioautotrophicum]|uniref:chemotaxis protein CheA n=1 Tax=Desulfonatronum thioautotrophicum TaxID=617001 RepID=UPI0005EB9CE4|nr:chemotaxis protein CheA [Desulfonatronum thioautotrophicum]